MCAAILHMTRGVWPYQEVVVTRTKGIAVTLICVNLRNLRITNKKASVSLEAGAFRFLVLYA
jgi:hypothetical protein